MSHKVEDGFAMIAAAQKYNRIAQIGSQRVSSIIYAQAKQMLESGKLGKVYSIEAYWDRNSPSGAWVYPIPPDASPETIDWNTFLGDAPKRAFSKERFFRWRCFSDYGEGLAGDLFVHLISGIHFITGGDKTNDIVASRAQSTGGLYHFKDGRDFPDLIETLYDYPDFRVYLRCNLNNDQGEFIGFYGTEGTAIIKGATLTFTPQDTRPQPEAYSIYGWPAKLRDQYLAEFEKQNPLSNVTINEATEVFGVPQGYSDLVDHQAHFFSAVRTRNKVVENEEFGNHAAIGCHLANYSYFNNKPAVWDAANKRITG
jgi:predicted dehydrogenase